MNKKVIIPVAVLSLVALAGLQTNTHVQASNAKDIPSMMQDVFRNGFRSERKAELDNFHDQMTEKAVEDGVLTEKQKESLSELRDKHHEEMMNEDMYKEMEDWAKSNNVDLDKLHESMMSGRSSMGMH